MTRTKSTLKSAAERLFIDISYSVRRVFALQGSCLTECVLSYRVYLNLAVLSSFGQYVFVIPTLN